MTEYKTPSFIVVARSDGRGGIKPFGTYGKAQAGAKVTIGNKNYTVGKDGRVNIPKAVMQKYGENNKDGRKTIQINFRTEKGVNGWKNVKTMINPPTKENKSKKTGDITKKYKQVKPDKRLIANDAKDFYPEL